VKYTRMDGTEAHSVEGLGTAVLLDMPELNILAIGAQGLQDPHLYVY
jgi:hypothetical protein